MKNPTLFESIISSENMYIAWQKARAHKSKRKDVITFEKDLLKNLNSLCEEIKNKTYSPLPLKSFVHRDPKTRIISKSDFRDRVVHHALINIIGPIFSKSFIYDSCANQKGKGTSFALKRFSLFQRKVTKNFSQNAFCLKADIKHYFQTIPHEKLINILKEKISDKEVIWIIEKILMNNCQESKYGMPLGNLTSQYFGNVYLHKLDFFTKNYLREKYYIRYVDDFIILHQSRKHLLEILEKISFFLKSELSLEIHPQKSRIISLSRGIDFLGFRNFNKYRLPRKRAIRTIKSKIALYLKGKITFTKLYDSYNGWKAHVNWGNSHKIINSIKNEIIDALFVRI